MHLSILHLREFSNFEHMGDADHGTCRITAIAGRRGLLPPTS